jgi:DNA-binding NtrC family response regulator
VEFLRSSTVSWRGHLFLAEPTRYDGGVDTNAPVVAVINSTPDIVDMLRMAIEPAGFVVVTALTFEVREGSVDIDRLVAQHDPRVIVYDIAPPYEANWNLFKHTAAMPVMNGRQFVLTSTNVAHVEKIAGPQHHIYEIIGKPFDLGQVVQAVKEASRSRPTR